jgi:hypothetical protein
MTGGGERPADGLSAIASPERIAGLLVAALAAIAAVILLVGPAMDAGSLPVGTARPSTAQGSQSTGPAGSALAEPDLAALRTAIALNDRLLGIADELEQELGEVAPNVGRLAESLRQANVAVVSGDAAIDRLVSDPATAEVGASVSEIHEDIRQEVGSTLANSLVNQPAYIDGSTAVLALIRSLEPVQAELEAMIEPSVSPSP